MKRRRAFILVCLSIWGAAIIACRNPKSDEERKAEEKAEIAQQAAAEGWEERFAKLQSDAKDKFPDPTIPAGASAEERRHAVAEVGVKRAKWVADWLDPRPKGTLNLTDLHVGDVGHVNAIVTVVTVHSYSMVVSYGGARFAVVCDTTNHATGHRVRLEGHYKAESTGDYGNATLVKLFEWKPDPKENWRWEQAKELLSKAKTEEFEASSALRAFTKKNDDARTDSKSTESPKPKGISEAERLQQRQAVYVRICTAVASAHEAAAKKFKSGTIPHQAFLDREIPKSLDALAADLKESRATIDAIRKEGDEAKWPKK